MRNIEVAVVTGPTGAVGTALCRRLASHGIKVYALVRPESRRSAHLKQIDGIDVVECDAANLAHLQEETSPLRADAFFHLAWGKTTGQGRNDMDTQIRNIRYTLDAARAASALGCEVFVGAGSQAEYGRVDHALTPDTPCFPENGYGMAKLCAGQMSRVECEKLGLDHVWARLLSVYGPHDTMDAMIMSTTEKLLRGERPSLTSGAQIWDYLYADDAAEALYRLAVYGKSGAVYPVGSGKACHLREYIETLRDVVDHSLPLGFGAVPYGDRQVMHLEADISALEADTGFRPRIDFETGIRKTIAWMREHK